MLHSLHLQKSLSSYNYIRVGAQLKVSFFSENQEEAEGAQAAHPGPLLPPRRGMLPLLCF